MKDNLTPDHRMKRKLRNLIMRARNVCKAPHVYVHTIHIYIYCMKLVGNFYLSFITFHTRSMHEGWL